MSGLLQLVIAGLAAGSLYALLALGLALVYQVSGIVNFAQGALATVGAYITWSLMTNSGLAFWPAAVLALLITFLLGGALPALLLGRLRRAPAATSLVVTLGLLSVIEGAIGQIWGFTSQFFSLPFTLEPLQAGSIFIPGLDVLTIAVAAVLIVAFFLFLRLTRAGAALRAVAQAPRGARLVGIRVERVRLAAWGLSAIVAAIAGILIAAKVGLSPAMADLYLLQAFAGAVVGGLDSLGGAAVGALLIGVLRNLISYPIPPEWHLPIQSVAPQWRDPAVFLLLLAVLLLRPAGLFGHAVQRRV